MKGLLIKDLINLKKLGKSYLMLFVFYSVFAVLSKNGSMLGAMVLLLCMMAPINSLSLDELSHWNEYALSLPVSRKTLVVSKYLLGILLGLAAMLLIGGGVALLGALGVMSGTGSTLLALVAISGVSIVYMALILPVIFRLGVEKGRLLMMMILMIPTVAIILLPKLKAEALIHWIAGGGWMIVLAAVILIFVLSLDLSISFVEKKEY